MTNETALREARMIYWQYMEEHAAAKGDTMVVGEKEKVLSGERDANHGVQIALRALQSPSQPVVAEVEYTRVYEPYPGAFDEILGPDTPQASPPPVQGEVTQEVRDFIAGVADYWNYPGGLDAIIAEAKRLTHSQPDTQESEARSLRIGWWNDMRKRGVTQDDAIAKINAALASPQHGDVAQQQEQQP